MYDNCDVIVLFSKMDDGPVLFQVAAGVNVADYAYLMLALRETLCSFSSYTHSVDSYGVEHSIKNYVLEQREVEESEKERIALGQPSWFAGVEPPYTGGLVDYLTDIYHYENLKRQDDERDWTSYQIIEDLVVELIGMMDYVDFNEAVIRKDVEHVLMDTYYTQDEFGYPFGDLRAE